MSDSHHIPSQGGGHLQTRKGPPPAPQDAPSQSSAVTPASDRYEILALAGSGGMGLVWKARDTHLKRLVAIKRIHSGLMQTSDLLARFRREAEAVAALHHPNIVQMYDLKEDEHGMFQVMQWIEGESVADMLKQQEKLNPQLAIDIICQVAAGLQVAHDEGIIHRDIKPSNILIDETETPYLIDFGLVRIESDDGTNNETKTGATLGTVEFMAPEQARNPRDATAQSDLWSLAATLYVMLTGNSVRTRDDDHVPDDIRDVLVTALKPNVSDRYQTVSEFASDLRLPPGLVPGSRNRNKFGRRNISSVTHACLSSCMNMIWRSKLPITAGLLLTLVISGAFRSGTRGPDSLSEQSNSNSRTLPSPAAEPTQALLEQSSQGTDTNDSNANIMMETHRPPAVIHIPAAEAVRESDCLELVRLAKQHAEAGETHEAELYLQQARTRICDRLNVVAAQHQAVSSDDLAMLADFIQLDNDDHADMARELVQYLVSSEADSETIRRDVEALTSLELVDDVEVALLRLEKLQNINAEDTPDAFRQSLTGLQREASVFVRQPAKSVVRKALDHWELCVRQAFERANDDYKRLTLLEPLSSELGDPGVEIAVAARLIELCPLDDHSEIAKNVERIMSLHRSPADLSIAACRRLLQYSLINKEWAEADRWLKTIENRGGMSDFERDQRVALRNISFANELVQRWIGRPIPFCLTGVNEHDKRFQGDLNLILMEVVDDQLKGRAAFSMHGTIADVKGDISADGLRLVLDLAWIDPIVLTPESARSGYDRIKWSGMADNRSSRLLLSELATGKDCVFVDLPRNTFPLQYYCRESQRRGVSNQGVWFDPYQTDDLRLFFQSVPYRGTSYFSRTTFPEVKPISFDMTDLCTTSDVLVKGQMLVRSPSSRYQTLNVSFTLDASPKPFRQIPVSLIQTPKSLSFMDFGKAFGWCDIELLVKQGTRLLSVTALESVLLNGCIVQTIDVPSQ